MITTDTHVYFWGGPFSNWHRHFNLIQDPLGCGAIFQSSEQAFMWQKALFFNDHRAADLIENEVDPKLCKKYGRQVKGFDPKLWSCVCLGFMTYVNYLKYSQNAELRQSLLDTGTRTLVEASPYDKIWGVGLSEYDPLILDEKNWRGQNLLGKALMDVRSRL